MQNSNKTTSSTVTYSKLFIHSVMLASLSCLSFAADSPLILLSRGAHERLWMQTNEVGEVTTKFTEVATGLCRWDSLTRSWQDSNPEIEVRPGVDGGIADKASHILHVASDANSRSATVDVTMPDGSRIQLQTVGLALTALDNSDSVFISELQQSIGEKVDANTVIYRNAFTPVKADLRVRNSLAGVESDVILRERLDPTEWGFQADSCRLEVWTQVIQSPAAIINAERIAARHAGNADQDQQIDFPSMSFTHGSAFQLRQRHGQADKSVSNIRVAKEFTHIADVNMTFLIESVPFGEAADAIQSLPINEARLKSNRIRERQRPIASAALGRRSKPTSLAARLAKSDRHLALSEPTTPIGQEGYVIDYTLSQSQNGYTFRGDTTYLISGLISIQGTPQAPTKATFEGGAVIKLANGSSLTIAPNCQSEFLSSPFRPVIFTAADDHTVGDKLNANAQINPGTYFGTYALRLDNASVNPPHLVKNAVFRFAHTAVSFGTGTAGEVRHAQFLNCEKAIDTTSAISIKNALICHGTIPNPPNPIGNISGIAAAGGIAVDAQHVTIDSPIGYPFTVFTPSGGATLTFWNSIIYGPSPSTAYTKYYTLDSWPSNPFQSVGAGGHYLNPFVSGAHNAGAVTGVMAQYPDYPDAALLLELKQMATEGPQLINYPISAATTFKPTAVRDLDVPDLGYHYDPLDYLFTSLSVNAPLTLSPGVNLAMYGNTGINVSYPGNFTSAGAPDNLNHFVHYQMVQEQPTVTGWPTLGTTRTFFTTSSSVTKVSLTFCDFSPGGGSSGLSAMAPILFNCSDFSISHSYLRNIGFANGSYGQVALGGTLSLTNNCWDRCNFQVASTSDSYFSLNMYNNLLVKGNVSFSCGFSSTPWVVKDNLFDSETLYASDPADAMTAANNAFSSSLGSYFGSAPKTGITTDYQSGPLGRFYYPATVNGANLATLLNVGSRVASTAGLSHFTSTVDNLKEVNDVRSTSVDIGFHRAAYDEVWIEDTYPPDAIFCCGTDTWGWDTSTYYSGNRGFKSLVDGSPAWGGQHQWFYLPGTTSSKFYVSAGERLVFYVYIPSSSSVSAIMMQWAGSGNADWSRAHWSTTQPGPFSGGVEGTYSQYYMGPLPPRDTWVRLEVPATLLSLVGKTVTGFGFTRNTGAGKVIWDRVGKSAMDGNGDGFLDYLPDGDSDGAPDIVDARPNSTSNGILSVTIEYPATGSTIN